MRCSLNADWSHSYVFAHFQIHLLNITGSQTSQRTIPTFLTLYIFGFLYQLVLVWDALRMKNTIQVIGLVMYNVGLLIYGSVQMSQIKDAIKSLAEDDYIRENVWSDTQPFLIAIPIIIAVGTVLLAGCAWKLYDEFAWTIYKRISADLRMKRRYLQYQVYIALLKFDFFFFLGFTCQFVVIVNQRQIEFALTIAAIPVTIIILLAAAWFVRKESLIGTIIVIVSYTSPTHLHLANNIGLVSLLRRSRLLHFQDGPNVLSLLGRRLLASTERTHYLRRPHPHPDRCHNRLCMHLRTQLQQGSQAVRQQTAERGRRREAHERKCLCTVCDRDGTIRQWWKDASAEAEYK